MSDKPHSRDFFSAVQPGPHDDYSQGGQTRNFQGSIARNRNRRTDIPNPPPPYICKTVFGARMFGAFNSFAWMVQDGDGRILSSFTDVFKKYWTRTVTSNNTQGEIYFPPNTPPAPPYPGFSYPVPITNTYHYDPDTNVPSADSTVFLQGGDPPLPPTVHVGHYWYYDDFGGFASNGAALPGHTWYQYGRGYGTTVTVDTWHTSFTMPSPPIDFSPYTPVFLDQQVNLSDEVDFSDVFKPMHDAIAGWAYPPEWGQSTELTANIFQDFTPFSEDGIVFGPADGTDLSLLDFSSIDGAIEGAPYVPGAVTAPTPPIAYGYGNFDAPLGINTEPDIGGGTWNGAKTMVLFLRHVSYQVTQYEYWSDGSQRNPTVTSSGRAKPGMTVELPEPDFFVPVLPSGPYYEVGNQAYRIGTFVQLIAPAPGLP